MTTTAISPTWERAIEQIATAHAAATVRDECLAFAAQYPTPNVQRAIDYARTGRLTWEQIHGLFTQSLGRALSTLG